MSKMSYEETAGLLEYIIANGNSKKWYDFPKDWCALRGAYIDYEKKRIVLAISPDELITANTGMKLFWIMRIAGYLFGLAGLIFPFIFKPEWSPKSDLKSVIIGCLLITILSAGMILLSHFDVLNTIGGNRIKRLRRYIRLISDEKMTLITDIAHAIKKPVEFVRKDLQKDIDLHLLANAQIDHKTDKIVIVSSKNKSAAD